MDFASALGQKDKDRYDKIVQARGSIYTSGLAVGVVAAAISFWSQQRNGRRPKMQTAVCQTVVIVEVVVYLYYMLAPKPELMVVGLASERLRAKWAAASRSMQLRQYGALALAVCAVTASSLVVCA
jgi:hypothetical protein